VLLDGEDSDEGRGNDRSRVPGVSASSGSDAEPLEYAMLAAASHLPVREAAELLSRVRRSERRRERTEKKLRTHIARTRREVEVTPPQRKRGESATTPPMKKRTNSATSPAETDSTRVASECSPPRISPTAGSKTGEAGTGKEGASPMQYDSLTQDGNSHGRSDSGDGDVWSLGVWPRILSASVLLLAAIWLAMTSEPLVTPSVDLARSDHDLLTTTEKLAIGESSLPRGSTLKKLVHQSLARELAEATVAQQRPALEDVTLAAKAEEVQSTSDVRQAVLLERVRELEDEGYEVLVRPSGSGSAHDEDLRREEELRTLFAAAPDTPELRITSIARSLARQGVGVAQLANAAPEDLVAVFSAPELGLPAVERLRLLTGVRQALADASPPDSSNFADDASFESSDL